MQHEFFRLGKLLVLGACLVAVGGFSAYLGMRMAVRSSEVEVPGLVGKNVDVARSEVSGLDLRLAVMGERYDPVVPEGAVVTQLPAPGGRTKANREVQVIVSLGPRVNPVPNLIGSSERAARLMAGQAGYDLGSVSRITLAGFERDSVIRQYPPPNSTEVRSPRIDILLSRPPAERYVMPEFLGQSLHRAVRILEQNGFTAERIQYRSQPDLPRGTVVRQFPEAGHALSEGEPVRLEVSR